MKEEVRVLKSKLKQMDAELETIQWYVKFYEDGRDIKKVLQDQERALKRIDELILQADADRREHESNIKKKNNFIKKLKNLLKKQQDSVIVPITLEV